MTRAAQPSADPLNSARVATRRRQRPAAAADSGRTARRRGVGDGTGGRARSTPSLLLSLALLLSPGALLAPLPSRAQAGAPDMPIAPVPPGKVLQDRPTVLPAVQALRTEALASHCAACHGTAGRAVADSAVPGLAGLTAAYLADQLRAFKSGGRQATVMHQIAKGYSDPQIDQLAAYFAAQPKAQSK